MTQRADSEFIRATTASKDIEIFDGEQMQMVPEKDSSSSRDTHV